MRKKNSFWSSVKQTSNGAFKVLFLIMERKVCFTFIKYLIHLGTDQRKPHHHNPNGFDTMTNSIISQSIPLPPFDRNREQEA